MPHDPAAACEALHCYIHHEDEPAEGAYLLCGECFHAYRTAAELEDAYAEVLPRRPASLIMFCPLCGHDF